MRTLLVAGCFTLIAGVSTSAPLAEARGKPVDARTLPRIETRISETANLVHWIDNLAGSSVGKTTPIYQGYWEELYGPHSKEDREALELFARLRAQRIQVASRVAIASGCLPVESERLSWRQVFMSQAMQADSIDDFISRLSPWLSDAQRSSLASVLLHFEPRFKRIYRKMTHVHRFQSKLKRFLGDGTLPSYLGEVAAFLGVSVSSLPAMRVSLIALPEDGPTHAEADGDDLLIEIRPSDTPDYQVQVLSHEATHFMMRRLPTSRIDQLAAAAYEAGEAGPIVWRYMWEGIPTALGQGVGESRLAPGIFSLENPWYHIIGVDQFAKAVFPGFLQALRDVRPLDENLMRAVARAVRETPLVKEARLADFVLPGFFLSGDGLSQTLADLKKQMGMAEVGVASFELGDPGFAPLLSRYACLGGVAVVSPAELPRAVALSGIPAISDAEMARLVALNQAGHGSILTGRRPAGALVFFLVGAGPMEAGEVVEAFFRIRGLPKGLLTVPIKAKLGFL